MADSEESHAQHAANRVEDARDRTVEAGLDALDKAKGAASSVAQTARDAARDQAETGVNTAARSLSNTAERLRDVAGDVDAKDQWLEKALGKAADGLDTAGNYLSGESLGSIVKDAQTTARRNPAAFMGGAAALGFVLARLGKATLEQVETGESITNLKHTRDGSRSTPSSYGATTMTRVGERQAITPTNSPVASTAPATTTAYDLAASSKAGGNPV